MIEILSFSFPQCKDLDRSKIAQKALIVDLFRHSNSCFMIKTGRILALVFFSKIFLSVQEYPKNNSFFEILTTKILMNRNLQKMLLTLNHVGCQIGDST